MLNPTSCAKNISDAYLLAAGLNGQGEPSGDAPMGDYPAGFASAYNDYAKDGIVLGAANTGGVSSLIEDFLRGVDGTSDGVDSFAAALANFWATVAIDPGTPAHGGTAVVSVINDATTKTAAFKAAILASYTKEESSPYFSVFINNIEAVVKTISWTVTEMMPTVPPAPVPYIEVIS